MNKIWIWKYTLLNLRSREGVLHGVYSEDNDVTSQATKPSILASRMEILYIQLVSAYRPLFQAATKLLSLPRTLS